MPILSVEQASALGPGGRARARALRPLPRLAVTAAAVIFGLRFFSLIWNYSVNVLFWDQWDLLGPFFHHSPGFRELFFEQWGPHREGLGLIADKFLYPLTNWDVRAESLMIGGCIFAAMLLALLLKHKLFGPLAYSDVVIPAIFLTLMQYESLIVTPNPAYCGFPLLMIMLYCLALLQRNRLLKYSLVLLLNVFLIYTGFGIFMGVITICVFALECFWSLRHLTPAPLAQPVTGLLVAGVSLGSFFVHYRFWPAVDCFAVTPRYVSLYPAFMAVMFGSFVGPHTHSSLARLLGAVFLLGVALILGTHLMGLLKRDRPPDANLVGAVLVAYGLLFSANTAVGRVCLGMQQATASRYMTLLIPAFLATYFYLLSCSWRHMRTVVTGLFVILMVSRGFKKTQGEISLFPNGKRAWAACYVRTEDIEYCDGFAKFKIHPYPDEANGLKEKLDYLKKHRLNLFSESGAR
jgi:hypothetical protein